MPDTLTDTRRQRNISAQDQHRRHHVGAAARRQHSSLLDDGDGYPTLGGGAVRPHKVANQVMAERIHFTFQRQAAGRHPADEGFNTIELNGGNIRLTSQAPRLILARSDPTQRPVDADGASRRLVLTIYGFV
eukprot:COSAG01_NODE_17476_length_1148_cov_4.181125_1_plen_132_part_00